MIPESDNCYGRIKFACDLGSLASKLSDRGWRTRFPVPFSPGRESLHVESDALVLMFETTDGDQRLFSGGFDGNRGEHALVKLSNDLRYMQIPHRFEMYDDSDGLYRELKFADSFLD